MPDLSLCIPTLDATCDRMVECLRAIRATLQGVSHEVVIIDNGGEPQGVADPANAAMRAARGEFVVFCSDDVTVLDGWWPPLREALDQGARVVFPTTVDGYMRHDFAAWMFAMTRESMLELSVTPGEFFDRTMKVWYQDTDLHKRLVAAGTPPVCVAGSRINHGLSKTIGQPEHQGWVATQIAEDERMFRLRWGQ